MENEKSFWKECEAIPHQTVSVAEKSSIGIGGKANAYFPEDLTSFLFLLEGFRRFGIKYFVLGNMTNVLPHDGDFTEIFIFTERMRSIGFGDKVFCQSGVSSARFLEACEREGRTGAEFLEGIPCSIGGAVFMNAGACGKHISDILDSALVYFGGEVRTLTNEEIRYGYKESLFMHGEYAILGASFTLAKADSLSVQNRRKEYRETRTHLPKGKSMGCVFKNPDGKSAGKLIEGAFMKGAKEGRAVVSDEHANFIINRGNATANDVISLAERIKKAVYEKYGVRLQEEIRYL